MISICRKHVKAAAYFLLFDMILTIIVPSGNAIYALTSGPATPEFSSFEPVATTNLVDPLSGNFTYNLPVIQIPGPDGGGYAMSLSSHSGTSPEEEASWVGHGWTLNPGAINRGVRGLPDEYDGTGVDYYNRTRPNWTLSGTEKLNLEIFSQSGESTVGIGVSNFVRFNNYQGLARTTSIGLSKGFGSLSMNRSATGVTFSATINPFSFLKKEQKQVKEEQQNAKDKGFVRFDKEVTANDQILSSKGSALSAAGTVAQSLFSFKSFTDNGVQTSLSKLKGFNFNTSFGLEINPAVAPIGIETGLSGAFSLNMTEPFETVATYGYLNTPNGMGDYKMDYFTEKGQPFDNRDYFIGIPFSTPDNYMLTGEGLFGGFRPYKKSMGNYYPEKIEGNENKIRTFGVGVEFAVGTNVGVGVNLAFGNTKSTIKEFADDGFAAPTPDDHIYRFYGDMGGKVEYGGTDISKSKLDASPDFPGITQVLATGPNAVGDLDETEAKGSSYIQKEGSGFSIYNEAGLKYSYDVDMMVRNTASLSIDVNENDRIDKNYLAFKELFLGKDADDKYKVNVCAPQHKVVVGDIKTDGYAATSLLSSITTSDYIDLGQSGPDDNDFGGWTKFEYHKKYGENSEAGKWYRWRIPYNGLLYSKNSISDIKDDTGFVTTGEKEINFLKKIETKTHIAYFVTNKTTLDRFGLSESDAQAKYLKGTMADRFDGLAAEDLATTDPSASNPNSKNTEDQLEYLEKVVLFAKDRPETPLQTTNFKYDYSLVSNLPNNINGNYPSSTSSTNSGKLTLRKVWSEFEGVINARTSSYKFDYRYMDKADYPDYLVNEHPELDSFFNLSDTYSVNAQNPDYSPYALDAWGFNQYKGAERHLNLVKWPYQGNIPQNAFDPAAWQLKQVTLPSGGKILVEYEGKDYSYVQDRNVMAMVKLAAANDNYENPTYTLNLEDIGYDAVDDTEQIEDLHQYLRAYFLNDYDENTLPVNGGFAETLGKDMSILKADKRIYFKLLYALEGSFATLEDCKSEYLTGYAKVKDVRLDGGQITIELDGASDGNNLIGVGLFDDPVEDQGYRLTPRQACYDYYVTQRWGKYSAGCESVVERRFGSTIEDLADCGRKPLINGLEEVVQLSGAPIAGMTLVSQLAVNSQYPTKQQVCKAINPSLSYLKIPINKAKRGDGIRVKRVLMYDRGIENGDAAIYGQEYKYELEDGRSSGVANNEPNAMREENPLVGFLPKEDQSWLNRLVAGKDREQSEGPIGESLLPSPSVKHARVVVENIHKGKTGSGHTVYEYFTCRDYPFDKLYDYSQNDPNDNRQYDIGTAKPARGVDFSVLKDNSYDDKLRIPTPNFSYSLDKAWASQGFRFIQNDMDGKPKSVRTYGGDYASGNTSYISSGQDFYYYEPGEKVPMLKGDGSYYWDTPGKEMDITMENFKLKNQNLDFNFEIDASVGLLFPPPIFVSGWLQFSFSEQKLSKYAVSKVIKYPAIQKRVVSYSDNIASTSENLGFDNATGRSVVTKTYDAYHNIPIAGSNDKHDGSIYSMNIPAHWNYAAMGRKTENSDYTNQLLASSGQVITYGNGANPINSDGSWNIKADKVISSGANTFNTLAGVTTWIDDNINSIYNSASATTELQKIWRLHQSYVYKGETSSSSNRDTQLGKVYEGGILDSYTPFDYADGATQSDEWVKLSEVTKYSPNGNALEEEDVLGVFSASRFGYDFTQPIMIAQNSKYDEIFFEHFEDKQGTAVPNVVLGVAHSGLYAQEITSGATIVSNVVSRELLSNTGGWLKFWTKSDTKLESPEVIVGADTYTPEFVAKTGEWSLYRSFIQPTSMPLDQQVAVQLTFSNDPIHIDDIKFNPKESQTTCFVYDVKSLRLLTLFDDQHFGLYYQYNSEGQLVRKLIETEKGLKTITETQYNTPRENRESF